MTNLSSFEREVRDQPGSLGRLLEQGRATTERIAEAIRGYAPRFVVIAARGTSDNAARYGQYLFGIRNNLVVALAAPSIITQYKATPSLGGGLVIGISQSGQSPDIVAVLSEAHRQGALTLALTNDPASPLARAAAHTLPLLAGEETAVAATKTYTAQLLALAMISASLSGSKGPWEELTSLPARMGEALSLWDSSGADLSVLKDTARLLVIGRGYNLSTAFELALKLKETAYVMADPYSSADFLHGPTALLDPSLPLLAVAPAGREFEDFSAVLKLASERGSPLVVLSDAPAPEARLFVPLPKDVPEWLTPMVAIVPGQLLAAALARARGLTPDAPRGLKKVTLTR